MVAIVKMAYMEGFEQAKKGYAEQPGQAWRDSNAAASIKAPDREYRAPTATNNSPF
jgi:hypothetical protein